MISPLQVRSFISEEKTVTCGVFVPRPEDFVLKSLISKEEAGDECDCIREENHFGPHVFRTSTGKLIAWEDDMDCECCTPEEESRCIFIWEINEEELRAMRVNVSA